MTKIAQVKGLVMTNSSHDRQALPGREGSSHSYLTINTFLSGLHDRRGEGQRKKVVFLVKGVRLASFGY